MEATSKSAVAEAQARIDDEVALLKLPMCALLTRRNALSPVSRLPHEILATIFLYQAYSFYQDHEYSGTWDAPPWANVSYTCRHWRDVALNTSSLWSFLFVSPPRWTEELLSRSKTVPLTVHVNQGYWDREEMVFLEKVTRDVMRIQDLSLEFPYKLAKGVFAKLSASAPLLHTLRLGTPALQTLELRGCHIPLSSPIFTGLTTLRLTRYCLILWANHHRDALSNAEDILASQHSLLPECLDLPHLSRLALVAPFSAIVVFLSNVTVPLKTELMLCCLDDLG
ncbi:hypothetical protein BU15DRAFT_81180 [Melanogaster broomeanus]|nr:hypothetical protein BU15DRAFT_81180 [Melanogaster broomeanus]